MNITQDVYRPSLALLTDLYQLTMAYGYWKSGESEKESVFNLFFRKNPFHGGFTVSCGLAYIIDLISDYKFEEEDTAYLSTLQGKDGSPLFEPEFLVYLRELKFSCSVSAIPEGTIVFAHEPLVRLMGPILQCQLLETALLNIINFQSLIATKAARITIAAKGDPVLEFGLRRAQGIDGALSASRAAYIGGCASTSNVLAGKLFGIPVAGTHAHSWIMSFENELAAFKSYASAMPHNCVLLVDTYDTIQGIKNAIEIAGMLRSQGKMLQGIRIDSGDLAYFSIQARQMLDQAGFPDVKVVASNDLDEHIIASLKEQDAEIDMWGIGTKMVTAFDQPALGAVYKLSAIKKGEEWDYKIKLSEQSVKINNPGLQQVRRFYDNGRYIADMIFDETHQITEHYRIIDPMDATKRRTIDQNTMQFEDLLQPIFIQGHLVYQSPSIEATKALVKEGLNKFYKGVKRFVNPHTYVVGLHQDLYDKKMELILKLRNGIEEKK